MEEKLQQILHENQDLFNSLVEAKKKANKIIFPIIIIILLITGFLSFVNKNNSQSLIIIFVVAGILIAILLGIRHHIISKQNTKYKQKVIPAILSLIDSSFKYDINAGHTEQEFVASALYNKKVTDYKSDNLVSGMVGDTFIKISNVLAKRVEEVSKLVEKDGRRQYETEHETFTVFRGTFMSLDFNKHFDGTTILYPKNRNTNRYEKNMDVLLGSYEMITIENQDFNNTFDVFTTDVQNSLYILTPSFAELLLEFFRKTNKEISICFKNGVMYIGFEAESFLDIDNSLSYESNFKLIYKEIADKLKIVDDLQLNNRIWTKQ